MHHRVLAAFMAAILFAACASAPLDQEPISDEELEDRVAEALANEIELMAYPITVSAAQGMVTLEGTVRNDRQRDYAGFVARGVRGVRGVINNIRIR